MHKAHIYVHHELAGVLLELEPHFHYRIVYQHGYSGPPISLTLPIQEQPYEFNRFPPFFEGLLPEGWQLDALLRINKIDKNDLFRQLIAVGNDLVGAVTVKAIENGAEHA